MTLFAVVQCNESFPPSLLSTQVCFRDAMFPLLARMRHGLFYNTYLVPGCHGSGLMQAFSKHVIDRLGIEQLTSDPSRVRVTLLSRSTKHRRIVNEEEVCGREGRDAVYQRLKILFLPFVILLQTCSSISSPFLEH